MPLPPKREAPRDEATARRGRGLGWVGRGQRATGNGIIILYFCRDLALPVGSR